MGRYVESTLLSDEVLIYEAKVSWIIFILPLIAAAFFIVMGILWGSAGGMALQGIGVLCGLGGIVMAMVRRATTEIAVTDKRVILKTGLIRRETMEQFLEKIDSISVEQTIPERIFNAGTIIVRGSGQSFSPVACIDDPLTLRKTVNEQVSKIKSR